MEFRVLGPLEVVDGEREVVLTSKPHALLAVLLVHANEVVSRDRLIDALWGERPPETAPAALHVHLGHLRKALGQDRIETRPAGYRLRVGPEESDFTEFERLAGEGEVERALALWRGRAFGEFAEEPWARAEAARLEELRLAALEERVERDLLAGRHAQLVPELDALVRADPLRERPRTQLMLALYRCGRQADALALYQETRRLLVEELGIEPVPELRELYRRILNQDPALAAPAASEPAAAERAVARDERKVVTVLFCDLVGFASRAEQLDPEDVDALLSRYHVRLRAELERFGGTVEKFVGDAVLALFGAPVSHEDDAERAVRAALAIRDWIAESSDDLQVRFGVTTGEALVRLHASPAHGEAMAVGDVVNTAARLQQVAPEGAILVDETTYRASRAAIAFERVDAVAVKGKAEPVPVWIAKGLRASGEADAERPTTTLVGRSDELALLEGTFARSVHEASAQLVTIVGQPGIGKTRLLTEFRSSLDAAPEEVVVRHGRCLAYGDGITFWALGQIVKEHAGILESDAPELAAEKLATAVAAVAKDAEQQWLFRRLAPLVGAVRDETAADIRESFAAWRTFLEAVAAREPLVLLIEDVHWADEALLEFLDGLVEWVTEVPLLVVATARPELYERASEWGGGKRNASTIALAPLSNDDTSALISELLADAALPPETERVLLERAGGNPLYAEEFVRMLGDRGLLVRRNGYLELASGTEIPVPDSLHAVIAARLDTLSPERKELVQTAAVVGKVFWAGALASIDRISTESVLASLHELGRKELVRRARGSSVENDVEYLFWHVLVRDVAYAQLPRAARARKHEAAAAWIERVGGEREFEEIVGYHLERAFRYRLELGPVAEHERDLATRAAALLGKAGRRALLRGDRRGAANLLERARALLPAGNRDRLELALALSHRLVESGDYERCEQLLAQALDEAAQLGDERLELHLLMRRAWLRSYSAPEGFVQEAEEIATRALRVFEQSGDELGQAKAWALVAKRLRVLGHAGNIEEAWERALDHARRTGDRATERETLHSLALTLYWGRTPADEATSRLEQILNEAEGDRELQARIKRLLAGLHGMQGRFDEARRLLSEAKTSFEELEMHRAVITISFISGPVEMWAGNPEAAESALRESCEAFQTIGDRSWLATLAGFLAEALYMQGKLGESEQWTRVSSRTAARDDLEVQADWRCVQAKLLARRGRFDEAETLAREALEIVERTGESDHKGDAYLDFAEICRLARKTADERKALRQAVGWYKAKGNLVMAGKAATLLAKVASPPSSVRG